MFYYCIVRVLCPQENGNNKKMKNKQTFIRPALLLTTLLLLTAAPAEARKKENRKSGKTENIAEKTDSTRNNRKKYEEILKDASTDKGMFDVHRKGTDIWFEIPDSLLDRDILVVNKISGVPYALNNAGINKGMGF